MSDAQRRTRLLRRHGLDGVRGPASPEQVCRQIVGLHATTASTVPLAAWARGAAAEPQALDEPLYTRRSLVKQLAMRRTLFVLDRRHLAAAVGAVGGRVAASERTNLLRDLRRADGPPHPEEWIEQAGAAVLEVLSGTELSSAEVRAALPELDRSVLVGAGKKYGGPSPLLPRVMNLLAARGEIVRGHSNAVWHQSRPTWTSMARWLGEPLAPLDTDLGHRVLIADWLRAYGPGTETDLVWWLGSTKTAVRAALAALDVTPVRLDSGETGYLMADDLAEPEPAAPTALLLPALDPATMGYKQRDFYLGPHAGEIFDSTGNGGQTAWWDGRIVGGWVQRPDEGRVEVIALEELPAAARRALDERAARLAAWLGADRPVAGFPSPLMRRHR